MFEDALKYDLLIFDCDGTIRESKSGRVVPSSPEDVVILPQARAFFDRLKGLEARPRIALCSNQMGVGQRYAAEQWLATADEESGFAQWCHSMVSSRPTEEEMEAVMQATADAVGADEWVMCCYWPPKEVARERPRPENPYPHQESDPFMGYEGRWSEAWRKPATGMLQWLRAGAQRTPASPAPRTLMVGNGDEDKEAAAKVWCDYMDAAAFWELVATTE